MVKERRGAGNALPGVQAIAQPVAVPIGAPIGPPFPTTVILLNKLSQLQLSALAMLFNDDFGINDGDALSVQRAKFQQFIIGL